MSAHGYANALKKYTRKGAVLILDGEVFSNPVWRINKRRIAITCENVTQTIWEHGYDDEAETEKWMRDHIRVLVDAKLEI